MTIPTIKTATELSSDMPDRIQQIVDYIGKQRKDTQIATGISSQQIAKYTEGASPTAEKLLALAIAGETTPDWILLGQGDGPGQAVRETSADYLKPRGIEERDKDVKAIIKIVEFVFSQINVSGRTLSPRDMSHLVALMFDQYVQIGKVPDGASAILLVNSLAKESESNTL